MSNKHLCDYKSGETIKADLMILNLKVSTTRKGSEYLQFECSDSSGRVAAKVWDNVPLIKGLLAEGKVARVSGYMDEYQGTPQIVVRAVEAVVDEQVDLTAFLPSSPRSLDVMAREIYLTVKKLENREIRRLLLKMLASREISERFRLSGAAKTVHHNYLGGLMEHITSMLSAFQAIYPHYAASYPGLLDYDVMVAGIILHDIGKVIELDYEAGFSYTTEGQLIGHITTGAILTSRIMDQLPGFPTTLRLRVLHLILSHHGELAYGSPTVPKTAEGVLLHYLDQIDSKLNHIHLTLAGREEEWSPYSKPMGRSMLNPYRDPPVIKVEPEEATTETSQGEEMHRLF